MKEDVSRIKAQNEGQNELITYIKTAVDFMIEDKKDQKEVNKSQLEALETINTSQHKLQSGLERVVNDVDGIKTWQKIQEERTKIDLAVVFRDNVKYLIGTLTAGGILYILSQVIPTMVG